MAPPTPPQSSAAITRNRILEVALLTLSSKGYDGTSLDQLAAQVGVTKQTVLHHYGSKDGLLRAVLSDGTEQLRVAIAGSLKAGSLKAGTDVRTTEGVLRVIDGAVRAAFRLAATRPELIAITREVARLGGEKTADLLTAVDPLTSVGSRFLQRAIRDGSVRPHDPNALLLGAYARVIGAAAEVEVLQQLGLKPSLRILVRRQNELLEELRVALTPFSNPMSGSN